MGAYRSCKNLLYVFCYDLHPKVFVHDSLLIFLIVLMCTPQLSRRHHFSMFSVWYNKSLTGYTSWSIIILKFVLFASWHTVYGNFSWRINPDYYTLIGD
jgi:hypothetical protein